MSRRRQKKEKPKKEGKKAWFTGIDGHKRQGKKLIPPMKQIAPAMQEKAWDRDFVPEFLWLDALAQEYPDSWWVEADSLIDAIEAELPEDIQLTGTISDFAKVPEEKRDKIIRTHKALIVRLFAEPIGRALDIYPDCPTKWLIAPDWRDGVRVNPDEELPRLGAGLLRLYKAKDSYCSFLRMMPLRRMMRHGKVVFSRSIEDIDKTVDMFCRYPHKCSEEEKERVEQLGRMLAWSWLKPGEWAKHFWRHNYGISPCRHLKDEDVYQGADDGKVTLEQVLKTGESNAALVTGYLDEVTTRLHFDLYDPSRDEVVLGLFSRLVRLYSIFVTNPGLWAQDLSGIVLRCVADTTFTLCFLLHRDDAKLFQDFVEYGRGKEKLLALHLQDTHPDGSGPVGQTLEEIASELGSGFMPELIEPNLANWTDMPARKMAEETGLLKYHRLVYDPTSAELHGSWTSIRTVNLGRCLNPLHRFHRIPQKLTPPLFIDALRWATELIQMAIERCVGKYKFPSFTGAFEPFAPEAEGRKQQEDGK